MAAAFQVSSALLHHHQGRDPGARPAMNAIELLNQAQSLFASQDYDAALNILSIAEREGKLCPESILLKATCMQLSATATQTMEEILAVYQELLSLRPDDPRVRNEIGYFLFAVNDDAAAAEMHFALALETYCRSITEAATGLVKTRIELGASERDAFMTFESTLAKVEGAVKSHL
jgi:Tfp pilus assembly protein PilF